MEPMVKNTIELIRAIDAVNSNLDLLEPGISKAFSNLQNIIEGNLDESHIYNNIEVYSTLLNKDMIVIISNLYSMGKLDCCKPDSQYRNASALLDMNSKSNIFSVYSRFANKLKDYYVDEDSLTFVDLDSCDNLGQMLNGLFVEEADSDELSFLEQNTIEMSFDDWDDVPELGEGDNVEFNDKDAQSVSEFDDSVDNSDDEEYYTLDELDTDDPPKHTVEFSFEGFGASEKTTPDETPDETPVIDEEFDPEGGDIIDDDTLDAASGEGEPEGTIPSEDKPEELDDTSKYKDIKHSSWSRWLNAQDLSGVMKSLERLYESGYGLEHPVGVLTNRGVVASRASDGKLIICGIDNDNGNNIADKQLYAAIKSLTDGQYAYFSHGIEEETYENMCNFEYPLTLTYFHIRNIFGHIRFCTNQHSLQHYLTTHNIENQGNKVIKWSNMKGYVKEAVENMYYDALIHAGLPLNDELITADTIKIAEDIVHKITNCIKNVVIVVNRKNGVYTRLKICTNSEFKFDIESALNKYINRGTTIGAIVKLVNRPSDGVYDLNIIYNDQAYSRDALFAYQVVDTLHEQNIYPSWSNVILGKDLDGNIFTYNFKDPNNSTIAIYGSKGSGKGVMTLNLVASALADQADLIYIDGKPETGTSLAEAAWKQGVDACVFNGMEVPGAGLEDSEYNIRVPDRYGSLKNLPAGLFITQELYKEFCLITTYYRGLELVIKMAEERMAMVQNGTHPERWLVAVFDECQQICEKEKTIVELLKLVKESRKKVTHEVTNSRGKTTQEKIDYTKDPIYKFVESYETWRSVVKSKLAQALGSTFRLGEVSVIYLWQKAIFPDNLKAHSILAYAIASEGSSMVKLVGRAALEKNGSTTFGTPTSVKDAGWYDDKFTNKNGGYWAIGNNVNSKSMKVFRPFNVYTNASDKQRLITDAEAVGLCEADLIGISLNEDGSVKSEIGFEGYANKLLAPYGMNIAKLLNIGYNDANNFVISHGLGTDLLQYMYNAHEFNNIGTKPNLDASENDDSNEGFNIPTDDGRPFNINNGGMPQAPISTPYEPNTPYAPNMGGQPQMAQQTIRSLAEAQNMAREYFRRKGMAFTPVNEMKFVTSAISRWGTPQAKQELAQYLARVNTPETSEYTSSMGGSPDIGDDYDGDTYGGEGFGETPDMSTPDFGGDDFGGDEYSPSTPDEIPDFNISDDSNDFDPDAAIDDIAQQNSRAAGRTGAQAIFDRLAGNADNAAYGDMDDNPDNTYGAVGYNREGKLISASFEEGKYNPQSAYQMREGRTFITPVETLEYMKLTPDNCIPIVLRSSPKIKRIEQGTFRHLRSTQYELEYRWKYMLKLIDKQVNGRNITKVIIYNDMLMFGNKIITCEGILGGEQGVEVCDIVNFAVLNKYFPNIKSLIVDVPIAAALASELNTDSPATEVFNIFSRLDKFGVRSGQNIKMLSRQEATSNKAKQLGREAKLRNGLDAVCLSNTTKKSNKTGVKAVQNDKLQRIYNNYQRSRGRGFFGRTVGSAIYRFRTNLLAGRQMRSSFGGK